MRQYQRQLQQQLKSTLQAETYSMAPNRYLFAEVNTDDGRY
jgi:hypothetical protein